VTVIKTILALYNITRRLENTMLKFQKIVLYRFEMIFLLKHLQIKEKTKICLNLLTNV